MVAGIEVDHKGLLPGWLARVLQARSGRQGHYAPWRSHAGHYRFTRHAWQDGVEGAGGEQQGDEAAPYALE